MVLLGASGCPGSTECSLDNECRSGEVCARSSECLPTGQVWEVQVRWTIAGAAPSATTCAPIEPVGIQFQGGRDDELKYSPIACASGLFTVDKLPIRMNKVQLNGVRADGIATIPATGNVTIDLR
jgi:hypothetical protein